MNPPDASIKIVPANRASCDDLQTVFGTRGAAATCQCQRYKAPAARVLLQLPRRGARPPATHADRVRQPRLRHHQRPRRLPRRRTRRLVRHRAAHRLHRPRTQQPRPLGRPQRGQIGRHRLGDHLPLRPRRLPEARHQPSPPRAAVDFARDRGARALEAYPIDNRNVISEELHVGTQSVFADAGLAEVSRPTKRRLVMRIDF